MVKQPAKKKPPVRIEQGPNRGEHLQRLHQVFIDVLRTKLDTALVLAQMSQNRVYRGFSQRARELASRISITVLIQLSERRIGTQDRLWVEKKLEEIDRLLIEGLLKEYPDFKYLP